MNAQTELRVLVPADMMQRLDAVMQSKGLTWCRCSKRR